MVVFIEHPVSSAFQGICLGIWSSIKDNQKKVFSEANVSFSKLKWRALFFSIRKYGAI